LPHGFALGGGFLAKFAAGIGLAIQSLGDGGWAAHIAEQEHLDLEVSAVISNLQHVTDVNFTRCFRGLTIGLNPS
jgi:hypothetical protein